MISAAAMPEKKNKKRRLCLIIKESESERETVRLKLGFNQKKKSGRELLTLQWQYDEFLSTLLHIK